MPEVKEEIKVAVDEIRSKAGAEIAEKIEDSLISIVTKTNSMVTQIKESESEVKELRAEAYSKRHALKDLEKETEVKIRDYEDKIKSFEENNNNEENEAELTRLRNFEKETIESQRLDFKSFVEGVKDHDKFSKVLSRFKIPSNDDGIDFEGFAEIQYDDLKHNLTQMKDLQDLEYFDSTPSNNKGTPPPGGKSQRGTDKAFNDRMGEAKTHKEVVSTLRDEGVIN
jgi:hypothetical protein